MVNHWYLEKNIVAVDLSCFYHMRLAATFLEGRSACSALFVDMEADSEDPLAAPGHYASSRHCQGLVSGKPSDQVVDWAGRFLQIQNVGNRLLQKRENDDGTIL